MAEPSAGTADSVPCSSTLSELQTATSKHPPTSPRAATNRSASTATANSVPSSSTLPGPQTATSRPRPASTRDANVSNTASSPTRKQRRPPSRKTDHSEIEKRRRDRFNGVLIGLQTKVPECARSAALKVHANPPEHMRDLRGDEWIAACVEEMENKMWLEKLGIMSSTADFLNELLATNAAYAARYGPPPPTSSIPAKRHYECTDPLAQPSMRSHAPKASSSTSSASSSAMRDRSDSISSGDSKYSGALAPDRAKVWQIVREALYGGHKNFKPRLHWGSNRHDRSKCKATNVQRSVSAAVSPSDDGEGSTESTDATDLTAPCLSPTCCTNTIESLDRFGLDEVDDGKAGPSRRVLDVSGQETTATPGCQRRSLGNVTSPLLMSTSPDHQVRDEKERGELEEFEEQDGRDQEEEPTDIDDEGVEEEEEETKRPEELDEQDKGQGPEGEAKREAKGKGKDQDHEQEEEERQLAQRQVAAADTLSRLHCAPFFPLGTAHSGRLLASQCTQRLAYAVHHHLRHHHRHPPTHSHSVHGAHHFVAHGGQSEPSHHHHHHHHHHHLLSASYPSGRLVSSGSRPPGGSGGACPLSNLLHHELSNERSRARGCNHDDGNPGVAHSPHAQLSCDIDQGQSGDTTTTLTTARRTRRRRAQSPGVDTTEAAGLPCNEDDEGKGVHARPRDGISDSDC